jgi:hypothetical protein
MNVGSWGHCQHPHPCRDKHTLTCAICNHRHQPCPVIRSLVGKRSWTVSAMGGGSEFCVVSADTHRSAGGADFQGRQMMPKGPTRADSLRGGPWGCRPTDCGLQELTHFPSLHGTRQATKAKRTPPGFQCPMRPRRTRHVSGDSRDAERVVQPSESAPRRVSLFPPHSSRSASKWALGANVTGRFPVVGLPLRRRSPAAAGAAP